MFRVQLAVPEITFNEFSHLTPRQVLDTIRHRRASAEIGGQTWRRLDTVRGGTRARCLFAAGIRMGRGPRPNASE
jgi:hypothetical protein